MSTMNSDCAFETFETIFNDIAPRIDDIKTEEDAKIQIILRFFTDVLGWAHADIGAERKHENGFSDLLISHEGHAALLCEAKRVGLVKIETRDIEKLRHLKLDGPSLNKTRDGIHQAVSYAAQNGIILAVLTDGLSWIIFKSFTPGTNFASHEAFVFPSLTAIKNDFAIFYELLSKSAYGRRLFSSHFDTLHNNRVLISQPLRAPFPENQINLLQKTDLAFDLDQVFNAFFGRLAGQQDDDLLVECFVESRESRFADLSLEKITANVLGNISPPDRDVNSELHALIENAVDVEVGQTVFVVGPTGSGKTTFLDRFFKKTLSPVIRERCAVVRINCLDSTGRPDTVLRWLTESLIKGFENQLYEGGSPSWADLQGLYFTDYERRRKGVDAQLYERDKQAFKEKFGLFLDDRVENDREGYLRRILADVVHNRHKLPILLVDNTDEFSAEIKAEIFQFSQALRRSVNHCIVLFPVTDKSAWAFSKTDIYGIYKSKSFFLPTPPPREVFRKRIDFIRSRVTTDASEKKRKDYFIGKGIRLSIDKISSFASLVQDVFVDDDYTSAILGDISNYNIRKTLELAQRIITSSTLKIDDIFKSAALGQLSTINNTKIISSLLKGDYELYRQNDNHHIYPIFQASDKFRQSPLLCLRVICLLADIKRGARNVEGQHLDTQSICDYFTAVGHAEGSIESTLLRMLQVGLIESYDPSIKDLLPGQRLALTPSGERHMKLALNDVVFFEQMALTTAILNHDVSDRILNAYRSDTRYTEKMVSVRALFADYLLEEDQSNLTIPREGDQYESQRIVTERIRRFSLQSLTEERANPVQKIQEPDQILAAVLCVVDWFDIEKGYGFVDVEGQSRQAHLRIDTLNAAGIGPVFDGDKLLCDVSRNEKGLIVSAVYDVENNAQEIIEVDGTVIRLFNDRRYGFLSVDGHQNDAFFRYAVLSQVFAESLAEGMRYRFEASPDKSRKTFTVRRFIEILT